MTGSTSITIPRSILVSGTSPAISASAQFTATATLSSSVTQDVTAQSTWGSSNNAVATVSNAGLVTAIAVGTTTISATFQGVTGSIGVTISNSAQTFSGTLAVHGANTHPFTVQQIGEVDVTLVSAGPPPTIAVGLGLGTPSGSTCSLLATVTATAGVHVPQISGTVTKAGSYCLSVFDVGSLVSPITYTVTVAHP
jgi:hypothetical protein